MSGPTGRRAWRSLLLIGVLVLCGAPLAWRYRPLTAAERPLVGVWRCVPPRGTWSATYEFQTDHRYRFQDSKKRPETGTWTVSEDRLICRPDQPMPNSFRMLRFQLAVLMSGRVSGRTFVLTFQGPDQVRLSASAFLHSVFDRQPDSA